MATMAFRKAKWEATQQDQHVNQPEQETTIKKISSKSRLPEI